MRGEADGDEAGDTVGADLCDYVGDEGVPVAHGGVDGEGIAAGSKGLFEEKGQGEGPTGERWWFFAGDFLQADLGVAMLEFFDDLVGEGAAASDLGEIAGHFTEDVGGSVGKEENSSGGGRAGASICLWYRSAKCGSYWRLAPRSERWVSNETLAWIAIGGQAEVRRASGFWVLCWDGQ